MQTYLVFNEKTGEVVQTHIEADDVKTNPDDLLKTVDPSQDRKSLDVLVVNNLAVGESYRVDVKTRTVFKVDSQDVAGFGGGMTGAIGLRQDPQFVKTVYTQDPPVKKHTDCKDSGQY